jgi:hypothetical protein
MAAVIAWLRDNALLAFALTAMATVFSALLAAVVTITATYLKSYLDKEINRKQSLREHHLAQLARFGALIDSIVAWDQEYLATVQIVKGPKLAEKLKALYEKQPLFTFSPSILMTLSSDEAFADLFWSRYRALNDAHRRCSDARGEIDYPDVDATKLDAAITEFATLSSRLYYEILQKIYE